MTDTVFLDESNNNNVNSEHVTSQEDCAVFVYTPERHVAQVSAIMDELGMVYKINYYQVGNWRGKKACFYKCNELNHSQAKYLTHIVSAGGTAEPLTYYLEGIKQYVELDLIDSEYLLDSSVLRTYQDINQGFIRRSIDVLVSGLILLLVLPITLLIAAAIKLETPGPVMFRQKRTGLHDREFEILKFRSMCHDAEKHGARWAAKNDSRITKVGRFIRKTRLDELPQLLNVLRGDMSLIGPRPEREVFISDLEKQIPFYRFRHIIKPGVTGWAQVSYSYGASVEDAREKHRRDLFYIKYRSLWFDMKILMRTVMVVLRGEGV